MRIRYICLAAVATAFSLQAQNVSLVQGALNNYAQDEAIKSEYAYTEEYQIKNFDKHGKITSDHTSKYEAFLLEGVPYLRKTEEDGHPLVGKSAKVEMQKYLKAVEERKRMTLTQKLASARNKSLTLNIPLDSLNRAYDSQVIGPEVMSGRETIHVQANPRSGADREPKTANMQIDVWIDKQTNHFVRAAGVLLEKEGHILPGTRVVYEWLPHGDVWLLSQVDFEGAAKVMMETVKFEAHERYLDYKKFAVTTSDSVLLPPVRKHQ
ncbi:MAG: hypothetical protein ACLGSH_04415 [Acidobacteriota bacterium]